VGIVRTACVCALLLLFVARPAPAWDPLQKARRAAQEAGEHLAAGRVDEAVEAYARAQALNPDAPEYRMGLGEALLRQGDLEGAVSLFLSAADPERPGQAAQALYNAGTALLEGGQAEKALSVYQRALLTAPPDEDLLHNLELAQRMVESAREEEQQSQDPSQQEDQQEREEGESSPEEDQQPSPPEDQESAPPEDQEDTPSPQEQSEQEDQQSTPPEDSAPPDSLRPPPPAPDSTATAPPESLAALPEGMTPQEAMRLLEALDHDEEELRRSIQRRLRGAETESEHEW
jgi:Ca-activated chloride channel family protein